MPPDVTESIRNASRILAEREPRTRDKIREVSARGYATVQAKGRKAGRAIGGDEKTWSERKGTRSASPLSRACEAVLLAAREAAGLESNEMVSAFVDATLKSVAMWPQYAKKDTRELVALLEEAYDHETIIQGQLNILQGRRRAGKSVDIAEEQRLWTEQATWSERVMAILDMLAERKDYQP